MDKEASHAIFSQGKASLQFEKSLQIKQYYMSETIKFSLISAPLYCLSSSLQFINKEMLLKNHLNKKSFDEGSKFNKIKESIVRPFKPSLYKNYRDAIVNLYKNGAFSFYKGNSYRLMFFIGTSQLKTALDPFIVTSRLNNTLREIITYTLVDVILHPLLFIESRYVIQNRKPNFRIYNHLLDVLTFSWKELYSGASYSLLRNSLYVIGLNSYYLYQNNYTNYIAIILAHVLAYPLLTIQRNIMFHSNIIQYLPEREFSKSLFKAPQTILYFIQNFGFLSLYRGFFSYAVATGLWHYYVPKAAKGRFYKNLLSESEKKNIDDLLEEGEDDEDKE